MKFKLIEYLTNIQIFLVNINYFQRKNKDIIMDSFGFEEGFALDFDF